MSTHKNISGAAFLLVAVAAFTSAAAQERSSRSTSAEDPSSLEGPNLGIVATPAQIAGWDISIGPDGANLPAGSGTAEDGAGLYAAKCLACHGAEGAGQPNDRLAGGHGSLTEASPVRTIGSYWPYATTVFDYIRRAMPYTQPQSLSNDEVYALTAYLLQVNGIIEAGDVMDARTLPQVEMPNRDNFTFAYPGWEH